MQERLLVVYYGVDRLPYKDENREVHYPIVNSQTGGTLITGENNTSKIYFYVGQIGGGARQWIANIKKPDGTLSYKLCTNGQSVELENGFSDYRVELDIASIYADQIGDVFIGLQGYSGDTVIVEDDGVYEISGDPIVLATGTIKIKVNYAPSVLAKGETISPTTEQLIMAALGAKLDKQDGIVVVSNIASFDYSAYNDGQMFYDKETKQFYKKDTNVIVRAPLELNYATVNGTLLTTILSQKANDGDVVHIAGTETITGAKIFTGGVYKTSASADNELISKGEIDDIIAQYLGGVIYRFKGSVPTYDDLPTTDLTAGDVYNVEDTGTNYAWTGSVWDALGGIGDMSNYYTKTEVDTALGGKLDKVSSTDKVYGIAHDGAQTTFSVDYGTTFGGKVVRRDGNDQIYVPLTPTANGQAASKKYVDDQDSAIMEVAEGKCKTYVISYDVEGPDEDTFSSGTYYRVDGTQISTWADFVEYVGAKPFGSGTATCLNSAFNSQNNSLTYDGVYIITNENKVIRLATIISQVAITDVKIGDIILVTETNVPDRWVSLFNFELGEAYIEISKMESTKVDLTNYATLNTEQTFSAMKTFGAGGIQFSASAVNGNYRVVSTDNSTLSILYYDNGVSSIAIKVDSSGNTTFGGKFNPNSSGYGLTLPSTTSLTADSEIVDTASTQTISGVKTFSEVKLGSNWSIKEENASLILSNFSQNYYYSLFRTNISPQTSNYSSLGTRTTKWKDLHLSNLINPNSNNYGLSLPSTTSWTANKEIATTDNGGIMNVINASDIVNNTLTQAQYDLITNGKPTIIKGSWLSRDNIIISSVYKGSSETLCLIGYADANKMGFSYLYIHNSTFACQIRNNRIEFGTNAIYLAVDNGTSNTIYIQNKKLPDYPSSPTIPQAFIYDTDNTLKYINTHYEWYGTQQEYDALQTYDSNTIYNILGS